MQIPYATAGLRRGIGNFDLVRMLQRDLRALGYLRQGIDGVFQDGTDLAVRRLQYDLQYNDGSSTAHDGNAPVAMRSYGVGRIGGEPGVVDAGLASCIEALLADPKVPKLPSAADAVAANRAARTKISDAANGVAPTPFVLAILTQESNATHYHEPTAHDADNFVVVGFDCRPETPNHVTSRGYGMGQYTLFHHPPRPEEVTDFITDPLRNVQRAFTVLRDKFNTELLGATPGTVADDRVADHPALPLRRCRYQANDQRYLRNCQACAVQVAKQDVTPATAVYAGAGLHYGDASAYPSTTYHGVPRRADFLCDWPYAVRRYNGSGGNSYNYQARVLLHLLNIRSPTSAG